MHRNPSKDRYRIDLLAIPHASHQLDHLLPVQRQLVQDALQYLSALRREAGGNAHDAQLLIELADAYARIGDDAIATLRGIGGMAPAPEGAARESQLDGLARALAARREGGIWVRTYSLQNR